MIKIKKRISLEPFINREYPTVRSGINKTSNVDENGCPILPVDVDVSDYINENPKYGKIDKSFIYLKIFFIQSFDNMGLFTDEDYESKANLINQDPDPFLRLAGLPLENYLTFDEKTVTGTTTSQLERVTSYNRSNPFIIDLNLSDLPSKSFTGVLDITSNSIIYVIDGQVDSSGKYVQDTGVIYETFSDQDQLITDQLTGDLTESPLTTFKYKAKGYREVNTSLSAIIKEDKYLGIVFPPQVDNDVLIDRGTVNVMERHLKMSEIDSVEQLGKYGQRFFNVTKS